MRTLLFLLALALVARAQIHPSLPEPGTLDGLGVNIHFTEPQPGELEMIRAAGFRWMRMDFTWAATEPEPGRYDFAKYDSLLAALEKAGLRAYFILDYGHPNFADSGDKHPFTSRAGTQEFRDAFAKWAVAAVGHFKGRGIVWELWNEPNIAGFWKPMPDVQQYIALAKTVAAALEKAGLRGKSRAFPPGTKREAAGECLVGPATSVIDLPFLDACFAAGLLEVFDAISVHPYRQSAPESVAEEYRALRLLIRRHCAADAMPLGTYDPSRPNPARRIPILGGEWGYSAAWPSLGKDEAAREATQAKYLPRMFLTNVANDIPLSIWYDWRDDGDDPKEAEHRFGIVRRKPTGDAKQPFEPKPGYTAMKVMGEELKGMKFNKRIFPEDEHVRMLKHNWVLLFVDKNTQCMVVWSHGNEAKEVYLPATAGRFTIRHGDCVYEMKVAVAGITSVPDGCMEYIRPRQQDDFWRLCLAQKRLPLDWLQTAPADLWVDSPLLNSLKKPIYVNISWRWPLEKLLPGKSMDEGRGAGVHGYVQPWLPDNYAETYGTIVTLEKPARGGFAAKGQFPIHQETRAMYWNPLIVTPIGYNQSQIVVRIQNPAKQARSGRLVISNNWEHWPELKFRFDEGESERTAVITLGHKSTNPLAPWIEVYEGASEQPFDIKVELTELPGFSAANVSIHPDGDANVASTQSLTDVQPAKGASISDMPSVRLSYAFADGWKFVRIEPKDATAREITSFNLGSAGSSDARAFGIWVHGDGQGGTPCIRLRDATGQVHQVRGEPVSWKGWRYVTFPLRPAEDNGQTMIPLPGASAEQRVSWSHWGGANDGVVHEPIEWDSLFLLDGNRRAMEGEIFLSAPTLVH